MIQRKTKKTKLPHLHNPLGPPSSPPVSILLTMRKMNHVTDVIKNSITEKDRVPAGTL